MKNILAENMRRFGTKNLAEAATVKKGRKSSELVGRTVTLYGDESQGSGVMDIGIADAKYDASRKRFQIVGIDLEDAAKLQAYNAGKPVTADIEIMFEPEDNKFFDMFTGTVFYNRWLAGELNKIYHSN